MFREQHGVTLIEQLMSLLLGSVLITSLYTYFRAELYRTASVESKTGSLEDARGALDIIIRDLMNAGSLAAVELCPGVVGDRGGGRENISSVMWNSAGWEEGGPPRGGRGHFLYPGEPAFIRSRIM